MRKPTIKTIDGLETLWFGEGGESLHIEVIAFPCQTTGITVYGPDKAFNLKARVNWPSIGATTPEIARQFAKGMEVACKIAEGLNEKAGIK